MPSQPSLTGNEELAILFCHGLPADHNNSKELLNNYVKYQIQVYKDHPQWIGSTLSEFFAEDFKPFNQDMFTIVDDVPRRELREYLRLQDVYVPKRRGLSIPSALVSAVETELPWPENESRPSSATVTSGNKFNIPLERTINLAQVTETRENQENSPSAEEIAGSATSRLTTRPASSNAITSLMKSYSNVKEKYSGTMKDNFERKLRIFRERCEQSGVLDVDMTRAFSIMLDSAALQYYFDSIKGSVNTFDDMVEKMRSRFITEERTLSLTREWESTSLLHYFRADPSKTKAEALEQMIAHLMELQHSLPAPYRTNILLKNKILNACEGIEECKLARQKVSPTLQGVIADLHSSIATSSFSKKPPDPTAQPTALLTDRRRFMRKGRQNRNKTCFVSRKAGCWSTNHPPAERMAAIRKNKRIRAYFLDQLNQSDNEADEEISAATEDLDDLEAFLLDINDLKDDNPEASGVMDDETPVTFCINSYTDAFAAELKDSSAVHALTKRAANGENRRYTSGKFYGIAIDTCCSYQSTGGKAQFDAYCAFIGINPNISEPKITGVKFSSGETKSLGTATCILPIGCLRMRFYLQVVDADVPILLSLADMDRLEIVYDNLRNTLTHRPTGERANVQRKFGHPFVLWSPFCCVSIHVAGVTMRVKGDLGDEVMRDSVPERRGGA